MMTDNDFSNDVNGNNSQISPQRFQYWDSNDEERRKIFIEKLEERFSLKFEYIVLNCIVSIILMVAFLTDQFSLVILALLIAPLIIPIFSASLSISLGSLTFFRKAITTLFFASLITISFGLFSGFISTQNGLSAKSYWGNLEGITWTNIILILVGLLFAYATIIRNPKQSISVANVAIAYTFYLPLFSIGISLFRRDFFTTESVIKLFIFQFIFSIFLSVIILFFSGVRTKGKKLLIPLLFIFLVITGLVFYTISAINKPKNGQIVQTTIVSSTPQIFTATNAQGIFEVTVTPLLATFVVTEERASEVTAVPTLLMPPTNTPTVTLTPLATPVWAEIMALESNGVNVRADPGYNGRIVSTILNGTLVEVLPEVEVVDNITWVHIRLADQTEGWIVRDFLISSTPEADW